MIFPLVSSAQSDTCDVGLSITYVSCDTMSDGSVTVITNSGGPFIYQWNGGPLTNDPTLSNLPSGFVSVLVLDTVAFCTAQFDTILGAPGIFADGGYCPGVQPVVTAQPYAGYQPIEYIWSTGDSVQTIYLPYDYVGTVTVNTVDAAGCAFQYSVDVAELPAPYTEMLIPDTACERTRVPLIMLNTDADTVTWRWQSEGIGHDVHQRAVFTASGYQPVSVQGSYFFGCANIPVLDSIYIEAQTPAIFTAEQIPCSTEVELILGSNTDSCAFFIGDSLYFDRCNGYVRWNAMRYAEYTFTLYATQPNGCDDTLTITVDVRTEPTLFLANAFTPNGDGINDLWPVRVDIPEAGYSVEVHDRWGRLVWNTTNTAEQWDGSFGGAVVPIDVYSYYMKHRDPCDPTKEVNKYGHVTVLQ